MKRVVLLVFLAWSAFLLSSPARSGELEEAKHLAAKFRAEVEVRLHDGTRVDLLNATHAIEVDWAPKWAEAIGQSVHYALITDRKPAVLLLVKDPATEWQHLVRAARVCGHLGIQLYIEEASGE